MGSKGGDTTSTNTIQNADPWAGAQPFILDILQRANAQANKPPPQFFPGQTVAGMAPETLQSQQMAVQRAVAGSPLEQAAQAENLRTVQGQYLGLSPAQPLWNTTMQGQFLNANPNIPFLNQSTGGQFLNASPNTQFLNSTMSGDFLGTNPFLDATFAKAARPVTQQFTDVALPGIASMFSAAGRYGSGAQQDAVTNASDVLGRTLGDLATGIYGQNYQFERGLQQQASQQLGSQFAAERGLQQQAAGLLGSQFLAERALQADAANQADQAFGQARLLQQQATGMAPAVAGTDWQNIAMLGNVGLDRTAQQQQLIDDAVARFNFNQMAPAQQLAQYAALISGQPAPTSQNSTQVSQLPPPNRVGNAAGGALGGAGLAGTLGMSTGWGALIGGLLGYMSQ